MIITLQTIISVAVGEKLRGTLQSLTPDADSSWRTQMKGNAPADRSVVALPDDCEAVSHHHSHDGVPPDADQNSSLTQTKMEKGTENTAADLSSMLQKKGVSSSKPVPFECERSCEAPASIWEMRGYTQMCTTVRTAGVPDFDPDGANAGGLVKFGGSVYIGREHAAKACPKHLEFCKTFLTTPNEHAGLPATLEAARQDEHCSKLIASKELDQQKIDNFLVESVGESMIQCWEFGSPSATMTYGRREVLKAVLKHCVAKNQNRKFRDYDVDELWHTFAGCGATDVRMPTEGFERYDALTQTFTQAARLDAFINDHLIDGPIQLLIWWFQNPERKYHTGSLEFFFRESPTDFRPLEKVTDLEQLFLIAASEVEEESIAGQANPQRRLDAVQFVVLNTRTRMTGRQGLDLIKRSSGSWVDRVQKIKEGILATRSDIQNLEWRAA